MCMHALDDGLRYMSMYNSMHHAIIIKYTTILWRIKQIKNYFKNTPVIFVLHHRWVQYSASSRTVCFCIIFQSKAIESTVIVILVRAYTMIIVLTQTSNRINQSTTAKTCTDTSPIHIEDAITGYYSKRYDTESIMHS